MPGPPPPPPYLSPAWGELAIERVRGDLAVREAMRHHAASVLTLVDDSPPGRLRFLYACFDGEGGSDLQMGADERELLATRPPPTFVLRADYETFAALRSGDLTERQALLHRRLHVEGHKLKALALARPMQALAHALAQVPCTL